MLLMGGVSASQVFYPPWSNFYLTVSLDLGSDDTGTAKHP